MSMDIDISSLPLDVRAKLAELELELSDGDITQKGYKKKRARLLDPYVVKRQQQMPAAAAAAASSGTKTQVEPAQSPALRGSGAKRDDIRYHSEIRAEAVQAALARHREAGSGTAAAAPASVTAPPLPSGRRTTQQTAAMRATVSSEGDSTDDGLDDDDDVNDDDDIDDVVANNVERNGGGSEENGAVKFTLEGGGHRTEDSPSAAQQQQQSPSRQQQSSGAYVIRGNAYLGMPTNDSRQLGTDSGGVGNFSMATLRRVDDAVAQQLRQQQQQQQSSAKAQQSPAPPQSRTSAKIQQLMQTLAHPKRRPLPEMYLDEDDDELLPSAGRRQTPDSSAPRPQGEESLPVLGEPAALPPPAAASLEEALAKASTSKSPAMSTVEPGGRLSSTLSYAKLFSRSRKLAHHLLNRLGHRGDLSLKPGDRVALAYPGHDPAGFGVGFLACQLAGLVAVPVEPPPLCASATGFLLSSLEVRVLLTSDSFYRAATKGGHEPPTYPGWPPGLLWSAAGRDSGSSLATPPKDWVAPALSPGGLDPGSLACIEYAYGRDGSVRGVCITRAALLAHTRALCSTMGYSNGETMMCLLDAKRELGLWHGILAAICSGVHTLHVPYNVMKAEPLAWLRLTSKLRASVALAKSRDLYWSLLAAGRDSQLQQHRGGSGDKSDLNLASLRCLVVSDGANPWSLTSCDSFVAAFQSRGLRSEVMCPCAYSSESLTVSVRRPGSSSSGSSGSGSGGATGRGVLSMLGLSHGVVRVDSEASYTSLTLQDCGQVMPNAAVAVVKLDAPRLCRQDEVGEICVCAQYTGQRYWGLAGLSNQVFRCQPSTDSGESVSDRDTFVRTGLLGFLGPPGSGGLVFVCGSTEGLIVVSGRRHNSDDLIATVLAVEPLKFVHRGRIAVFSQELLRDERVVVVAEQRPDATEEQSFQWMSHVLQAVDSIHQVGVYCIALAPPNSLPRSPQGGVCPRETRRRYLAGQLHPCSVLLCPHSTVTNLPRPRELPTPAHGPMSALLGSLIQGGRPAVAEGRPLPASASPDDVAAAANLTEALRWRVAASASADEGSQQQQRRLLSCLNGRLQEIAGATPGVLIKRAEKLASVLRSRAHRDAVVAIALPPGLDLTAAVFACQLAACVPLPVRPPVGSSGLNTCRLIVESGRAALLLTTQPVAKMMRSKEAMALGCSWPPIIDVDDARRRHSSSAPPPPPPASLDSASSQQQNGGSADPLDGTAYLDFSVSTTGLLTGVRFTQRAAVSLCRSLKLQCELYPAREVALCLDPYSGLGFVLWCLSGVFAGHQTLLLPPAELEANPAAFLLLLSQRQIRDAFCSYTVLEHCTRELAGLVDTLKQKQQINLSNLRSLVVVSEERPRLSLLTSFGRLFSPLGLKPSVVSASFGCRVNPCVCLQGASAPDPATLYVDSRALRADRVSLVERGSPRSLPLMECGELLAGTQVIVANPDSRTQCADSHLGELWIKAAHNAAGYWSVVGGDSDACAGQFDATLVGGGDGGGSLGQQQQQQQQQYARTGFLGFVRRTDITGGDGARHDAVFVVGALDEALQLRGFRYHPVDIEATVSRCHPCVGECAVFTWRSLLVVVAELQGREFEALDLIPAITTGVLREHHLIAGVVVVCDPGAIPMNSRGEKQRMHLRDGFLDDKLDPIYVAYNL